MTVIPKPTSKQAPKAWTRTRRIGEPWTPWKTTHARNQSAAIEKLRQAPEPKAAEPMPEPRKLPEPNNPDLGRSDGTKRPLFVQQLRGVETYDVELD